MTALKTYTDSKPAWNHKKSLVKGVTGSDQILIPL